MKKLVTIVMLVILAQKGFSQFWGENNSRTDYRDNASLQGNAGAISGFFQTANPMNYPPNEIGSAWWHLLDVRHSQPTNNYSMQLASQFGTKKLYYRELNNIPTTPWSKILMETNGNTTIDGGVSIGNVRPVALNAGGLSLGNVDVDYTPTNINYAPSGSTLLLNAKDYTTIGFYSHNKRVDFIRTGQRLIKLGYDGGFGEASVGLPGTGIWDFNGNVGIGTITPAAKLQVTGGNVLVKNLQNVVNSSAIMVAQAINIGGTTYDTFGTSLRTITQNADNNVYGMQFFTQARFDVGQTEKMRITGNGFVGIGTTNPQEALSVNGNIRAQQVKVEITGWPDYVFAKEYSLLPLETLEKYIQTHQHLPEIPSASEIEKEGLNLGEINKVLVKKIEELSLYMLQQQQNMQQQQQEINKLKNKVDNLIAK